jgi:cob(I)alamin adenosyltransferase
MDGRQQSSLAQNKPAVGARPRQGLITIFTGDGRGKTTAALGTALRAAGHGLKVLVVFFMKGPDFVHGEISSLKRVSLITLRSFGARGWAKPAKDNAAHKREAAEALGFAAGVIYSQGFDVVVLDEIISAVSFGLLPADAVIRLMADKPEGMELILTGRGATAAMVEKADLVTEMKSVKHPLEKGIMAREGIDY